ncbi:hypothetical protein [uncultured Tateyamaria sp.]|uniref:DUF6985 domain-containing protein n=1 Tax=uncultured Tateyamaria sp. TaxID=455651 RepID=UPI0026391CD8|nr:hypothetical protein [uncultured Tateyamaria sp.]
MDFEFDEFFWIAEETFPVWAGFSTSEEQFGEIDPKKRALGTVQVLFAPEGRGEQSLDQNELALIKAFEDFHVEQAQAVLNGLFHGYPKICQEFEYAINGDPHWPKPPSINHKDDLCSIIQLHTIHIHQIERSGSPYVGYDFYCDWEEEHGLGVLMYKDRVVEIGDADSASTLCIVERDAGQN